MEHQATSYIAGKRVEEALYSAIRDFAQFVADEFYSGESTEALAESLRTIERAARVLSDYNDFKK